jgi:dihydrofolate synthase/folylpolyglutamate synthase
MNDLLKLSEALGNPHEQRAVHVVGTNGKGSVSLKTSRALQSLGMKTALFTSPHIFSFRERLLVQGEMATEHEVVQLASQVFTQSDRLGLSPTMFEVVTLMGLLHFRNRRVDIAVLEAGMGGARDPTSICQGRHAAITSIGLDHCDVLGSTEEAICREKAGIIQDG